MVGIGRLGSSTSVNREASTPKNGWSKISLTRACMIRFLICSSMIFSLSLSHIGGKVIMHGFGAVCKGRSYAPHSLDRTRVEGEVAIESLTEFLDHRVPGKVQATDQFY